MPVAVAVPDGTGSHVSWEAADQAAAGAIAARHARSGRPVLAGLAGAQGSGKSTMAPRLAAQLAERGLRTEVLTLDDFYLTRAERTALAREIHPLLATRGVPGTHDTDLLADALDALLAGRGTRVPLFDKAADDRAGTRDVAGGCDVVLLEGWCIGARAEDADSLIAPINALEREADADGAWRRWVNGRLGGDYAALFSRIDYGVMLRAPDFAVVERWRAEQEEHLGSGGMTRAALRRFVQHFERITRAMLADPPADLVLDLDPQRVPVG